MGVTYTGRVLACGYLGKHPDAVPFIGFGLASRSDPDRYLEVRKDDRRVAVQPTGALLQRLMEDPAGHVDNIYDCIVATEPAGSLLVTGFNGRMSNRVPAITAGRHESVREALYRVLYDFPASPGDPRVGAVLSREDRNSFYFGVDAAGKTPLVLDVIPGENEVKYLDQTSINQAAAINNEAQSKLNVNKAIQIRSIKAVDLEELAALLHDMILGDHALGFAVCAVQGSKFIFSHHGKHL